MPGGVVARRFRRELGSLHPIFGFVAEFLDAEGLDREAAFDVDLMVEELFTNLLKHAPRGGPDVEVGLGRAGDMLTIVVRDFDVEPFDPTQVPPLDTSRPIAERRPGGMGLHLVRQVADTMQYLYQNRISTVTLTKRLEA